MKKLALMVLLFVAAPLIAAELEVGAKAPAFELVNAVDGRPVAFAPGDGRLSVIVFTCNQCPYAKAFEPRLIALGNEYAKKGVVFYAIDSNDDAAYPVETMGEMKSRAMSQHYPYPYLKDGESKVAREYGARVTPHIFVVDGKGVVRYRGYVDDSTRAAERQHTGLTDALNELIAGKDVKVSATKAFGCTIKFKG
ncbi:MAG TPA: thioredoxin family protein [Thermoanaerobaculia bacterium]|jgi:thiol-disulfide isomerase/thioredoxin|nr:thioredoxin family protein [Thermoanaerobaculia bacterium]